MDLMSIASFFNDFRTIAILIACVLAFYVRPFQNKRLQFLFAYLLITLASNIVAYVTRGMGNNIYLSYIIAPISLVVLTLLMIPEEKSKKTSYIIWIIVGLGILLNFYEGFGTSGGVLQYNSLSNTYVSVFIGALALWGLIRLRFDQTVVNLSKETMFWIYIAFAITNIGNILTTAFYRFAQNTDPNLLLNIAFTSILVSYVSIILVCIGLMKQKAV